MTAQRLVSLRQMLLTYSRAFAITCADIEMTRWAVAGVAQEEGNEGLLPAQHQFSLQLRNNLTQLRSIVDAIPTLDRLLPQIARLETELDGDPAVWSVVQWIQSLQYMLFDELDRHVYYHVEERLTSYYNTDLPFGEEVFAKYPSATVDIISAGKCIALGQGTAAVFHLMLVLELGLTSLGKALGIPYAPSWEAYLTQIAKKMGEKHARKTASWKRDEAFYRDVAGDLQLVKIAWRNPTMHIVRGRVYEVADAERIYDATRSLMQRLATKLKEPRRRSTALIGPAEPPEALV